MLFWLVLSKFWLWIDDKAEQCVYITPQPWEYVMHRCFRGGVSHVLTVNCYRLAKAGGGGVCRWLFADRAETLGVSRKQQQIWTLGWKKKTRDSRAFKDPPLDTNFFATRQERKRKREMDVGVGLTA